MIASFVLVLASASVAPTAETPPVLSVPYLSQTEDLCGGAAAAMIFRYWGDRYASVHQFASLVDRGSGGIRGDVLANAIRGRGWTAVRLRGSIETIRKHVITEQPLLLLIEDHPGRYHYVVAIGADEGHVYLHDPTWGPSRRYANSELLEIWRPTGFWALLVRPDENRTQHPPNATGEAGDAATAHAEVQAPAMNLGAEPTACDLLLDDAIRSTRSKPPQSVEAALNQVRLECPDSSRPVSELAALRFVERRWRDAETLAAEAVHLDPSDTYGWDVLGSSRYVADDQAGALQAWNHIDQPRVDAVEIEGLTRTQYALVAQSLDLTPATLLTDARLRLAARRLNDLPTTVGSMVSYRPDENGFAKVEATVVERRFGRTGLEWAATAARALANREMRAVFPGGRGQGEVWTAGWRWWDNRPRVAGSFSTPVVGRLAGVWRVALSWEEQTYDAGANEGVVREERLGASVGVANWLTADLRYELTAGADSWDGSKAARIGGTLERRLLQDRLALVASAKLWLGEEPFADTQIRTRFRSSPNAQGLVWSGSATLQTATAKAPLWAWAGAGAGRSRLQRLRAHPLLVNGIISGPAFGRQLSQASFEVSRWISTTSGPPSFFGSLGGVVPLGLAAFIDTAHVRHRLPGARGQPLQIDGGVGVRLSFPAENGTIRIDYARGLRDENQAVTFTVASDW
jgi:predicted double-glycine peptidase